MSNKENQTLDTITEIILENMYYLKGMWKMTWT